MHFLLRPIFSVVSNDAKRLLERAAKAQPDGLPPAVAAWHLVATPKNRSERPKWAPSSAALFLIGRATQVTNWAAQQVYRRSLVESHLSTGVSEYLLAKNAVNI
jgi:hypothetical protein